LIDINDTGNVKITFSISMFPIFQLTR